MLVGRTTQPSPQERAGNCKHHATKYMHLAPPPPLAPLPRLLQVIESVAGTDINTGGITQKYENVQGFLGVVKSLGLPTECQFSVPDLESEGDEDRPRIADCVLWLKRLHEGNNYLPYMFGNDLSNASDSPKRAAMLAAASKHSPSTHRQSPLAPDQQKQQASSMNPTNSALAQAQNKMVGASKGVTQLLHQCSAMLKERYTVEITQSSSMVSRTTSSASHSSEHGGSYNCVEAVGPVLESVLGGLTSEYERRLLMKDQEITSTKEKMNAVMKQVVELQSHLAAMTEELRCKQAIEVQSEGTSQRVQELEAALACTEVQLREREAALRSELDGQQGIRAQLAAEMQAQLDAATDKLDAAAGKLAEADRLQQSYGSIQEENKKLYNLVQDLKGAVRVFCRVRPLGRTGDCSGCSMDVGSDGELAAYDARGERKVFKFDRVFDQDILQGEIYEDVQPLIRSVLDGAWG